MKQIFNKKCRVGWVTNHSLELGWHSCMDYIFDNGRTWGFNHFNLEHINFWLQRSCTLRGGKIESVTSLHKFSNHSPLILTI
jgi:hypothetical protein